MLILLVVMALMGIGVRPVMATDVVMRADTMTLTGFSATDPEVLCQNLGHLYLGSGSGFALKNFTGTAGRYDISVVSYDENDGASTLRFYINNSLLHEWTLGASTNSANCDANSSNLISERVATGVDLTNNSQIKIDGTTAGGEHVRVVRVVFTPVVENVCGDGVVGTGEQCDDGNANDGDGCSVSCMLEGAVARPTSYINSAENIPTSNITNLIATTNKFWNPPSPLPNQFSEPLYFLKSDKDCGDVSFEPGTGRLTFSAFGICKVMRSVIVGGASIENSYFKITYSPTQPSCEGLQIFEYASDATDIYNLTQTKLIDNTSTQEIELRAGKRYLVGVNLAGPAELRDVGFAVVKRNSNNCSTSGDTVYSKRSSSSTRGEYAYYDDGGKSIRSSNETHYRFNWTPTVTGQFVIDGRVWNDGITEATGNCAPGAPTTDSCQGVTCARVYSPNCKIKVNVTGLLSPAVTPTTVPGEIVFNGDFAQIGTTTVTKSVFTGWSIRGEDGRFYVGEGGNTGPDLGRGKFAVVRSPVRVTTNETTTRFVQEIATSLDMARYKFNFKVKNYLAGVGNTVAIVQLIRRDNGVVVGSKVITADMAGSVEWRDFSFVTDSLPVAGNYNFRVFVSGGSQMGIDDVMGFKCANDSCIMMASDTNIISNYNFEATTEENVDVTFGKGWGRGQLNWTDRFAVIKESNNNKYLYFATLYPQIARNLNYRYEQTVPLEAGKTYKLKAKAAVLQKNGDGVQIRVDYASGAVSPSPALNQNDNIAASNLNFTEVVSMPTNSTYTDLLNSLTKFTEKEATFQVPATGNYYVRILVKDGSIASLDDISLRDVAWVADSCPRKAAGDTPEANGTCNGVIGIEDFGRWKDAFISGASTSAADFDGSGGVTIADFGIWKDNFINHPNL